MSEAAGKDRPVGITAHVVVLPAGSREIMESLGDVLIAGFSIEDRLLRPSHLTSGNLLLRVTKAHGHIAPVILLGIVTDGVVTVAIALSVATVSALEHVEVQPLSVIIPPSAGSTPTRMEGHQVVLVNSLDGACQRIPRLHPFVAHDVTAYHPDDIRSVFISLTQETAIFLCLLGCHLLNLRAPDAVHSDVDAL